MPESRKRGNENENGNVAEVRVPEIPEDAQKKSPTTVAAKQIGGSPTTAPQGFFQVSLEVMQQFNVARAMDLIAQNREGSQTINFPIDEKGMDLLLHSKNVTKLHVQGYNNTNEIRDFLTATDRLSFLQGHTELLKALANKNVGIEGSIDGRNFMYKSKPSNQPQPSR